MGRWTAVALAGALACAGGAAAAHGGVGSSPHAASAMPVELAVPFAPTPVRIDGAVRLIYELHLTNYGAADLELTEVAVSDPATGASLGAYKDAELAGMLHRPGPKETTGRLLHGGRLGVVYLETTLPHGAPTPASLSLRVTARSAAPPDPAKPIDAPAPVFATVPVETRPPLAIGFPLPAGSWVAGNGPSNVSGHRRALIPVDGRARISQRFAIDWVKLGPDGKLFHGDKAVNANWYGFGVGVLAVADATVAAEHDGVPENEPSDKRAIPITLETVGGDYLVLDLGQGRFAFYAHLQPGSLKVHVGDKVRRGQALALLGNTGNSDAPHLHFHIADAAAPLGAEGLPYVFETFQTLGVAPVDDLFAKGWTAKSGDNPRTHTGEIPTEDAVVAIP